MGGRSELASCESMGVGASQCESVRGSAKSEGCGGGQCLLSSSRCESVRIVAIRCEPVGGGMRWCEVGLSGKCWCGACLLRLLHLVCCESVMVCERGCVTVSSETLTAWCANLLCEPRCHRRDLGQRPVPRVPFGCYLRGRPERVRGGARRCECGARIHRSEQRRWRANLILPA